MKKFLFLQLKRMMKFMPLVLTVTLCLLIGLSVFLTGIVGAFTNSEEKQPITLGITGDTDNDFMKLGITAMETLDDTRYSIIFKEMSLEEAENAMNAGTISAYVIFPENFIEKAVSGEVELVEFVTSTGADNLATLFKNEICKVITDMMIYCEKGTYGLDDAMDGNGLNDKSYDAVMELSMVYLTTILHRSGVYEVTEVGFSGGLNMINYFVCGITVLLLFMMGLPYAIIYVKKDYALNRLLLSRGHSCLRQLSCEYISHFIAMFTLVAVVFAALGIAGNTMSGLAAIITNSGIMSFLLRLLPIIIMLSAFNIMAFELADNIVSGLLIHFFSCLCMCYVAGCFYPIYTFPVIIQKISEFLPTGMAVRWLSDTFTSKFSTAALLGIILYAVIFFFVALFVRKRKTSNKQRGGAQ